MFNIGITGGLEGRITWREESLDKTLVNTPEELQLQHRSDHVLPEILKVTVHGTLFRGPGNVHRRLRETCLARGPGRARGGFFHFPLPVPERGWGPPKRRSHRTVTWVRPSGRVRHTSAWPASSKRPEEASPRTATQSNTSSRLLPPSPSRFVGGAGSLELQRADVRTVASASCRREGYGPGLLPKATGEGLRPGESEAPRAAMGQHGWSISENARLGRRSPSVAPVY